MKNLKAKDVNGRTYHVGDRVNGVDEFDRFKCGLLVHEQDGFFVRFKYMRFEPTDQFEIVTTDMENNRV